MTASQLAEQLESCIDVPYRLEAAQIIREYLANDCPIQDAARDAWETWIAHGECMSTSTVAKLPDCWVQIRIERRRNETTT